MAEFDAGMEEEALASERLDADIEQAELERVGRRVSVLRRRGVCLHGWTAPADVDGWRAGTDARRRCQHCGYVFADDAAEERETRALRERYL